MTSRSVVFAEPVRTAIGTFGGSLKDVPAPELGAVAISGAVARAGIRPDDVATVVMGNVVQAGEKMNPARQAGVRAGLPVTTPALTVNRVTGATTWTAHTLYEYGRTLRMRGRHNDDGQAAALLSESATLGERIGMPVLLARARALGARTSPARTPPDDLSGREVDILRLVAAGLSNREIGQELCISGHTVANHVRSILRKTGAANRTEAAGYAHRHALLDTTDRR